jgi:hypothetical protein
MTFLLFTAFFFSGMLLLIEAMFVFASWISGIFFDSNHWFDWLVLSIVAGVIVAAIPVYCCSQLIFSFGFNHGISLLSKRIATVSFPLLLVYYSSCFMYCKLSGCPYRFLLLSGIIILPVASSCYLLHPFFAIIIILSPFWTVGFLLLRSSHLSICSSFGSEFFSLVLYYQSISFCLADETSVIERTLYPP